MLINVDRIQMLEHREKQKKNIRKERSVSDWIPRSAARDGWAHARCFLSLAFHCYSDLCYFLFSVSYLLIERPFHKDLRVHIINMNITHNF